MEVGKYGNICSEIIQRKGEVHIHETKAVVLKRKLEKKKELERKGIFIRKKKKKGYQWHPTQRGPLLIFQSLLTLHLISEMSHALVLISVFLDYETEHWYRAFCQET